MTRRGFWWAVILMILVVANVVGTLALIRSGRQRRSSERAEQQRLQEEQTRRVATWLSADHVAFTNVPEWKAALKRSLTTAGCLPAPDDVSVVRAETIAADQERALHEAVVGLVQVYIDNSAEALIEYMKRHGETVAKRRVPVLRKLVAGIRGVRAQDLKPMSPDELLCAYWRESGTTSRWWAIVPTGCCRVYWRTDRLLKQNIRQSIGQSETSVFQNVFQQAHNFAPLTAKDKILTAEGSILFCDVKLVILLDPQVKNEPVPYFLRFWYEPLLRVWHPYQMARVATAGDAVLTAKSTHVF